MDITLIYVYCKQTYIFVWYSLSCFSSLLPFRGFLCLWEFCVCEFNKPTKFMHKMGTIASLFMPWISVALFCNTNDSFLWKKQKNVCCGYYTGKMCCMSCAIFTFTLCTYNEFVGARRQPPLIPLIYPL